MGNKTIAIIAIMVMAISLMLSYGCTEGNTNTGITTPFIGGTNGLLMSFVTEAPPKEVYDGGIYPFDIIVELRNDGEYEVKKENAVVRILGIDPADFGKTSEDLVKQPSQDLAASYKQADTGIETQGDITTVEFPNFNYKGTTAGNMQMPIFADICYTYGTNVVSQLCIKKDPTDPSSKVCVVEEDKTVFSSSAPVQVTKFHESIRGKDTVGFTFTIQKKGNGAIYRRGSICNTQGIVDENKVWVEVIVPELSGTKCTGLTDGTDTTGYVTLYNTAADSKSSTNERTISCMQPVSAQTDYVKNVEIKLVYDYREDISTNILIKHSQ